MTAITTRRASVQPPDAEAELAQGDPALGRVIAAVIARIGRQRITPSRATPFEALARAIIYQSVSGQAAAAIFARLKATVGGPLTPAEGGCHRQFGRMVCREPNDRRSAAGAAG